MPDKRCHRGPHPEDEILFAPDQLPRLRQATKDLSWLLGRNYTLKSALKLVGDHFQLQNRQRIAVMRSACSDDALARRLDHQVMPQDIDGQTLLIDGYNLLISVEAALAGGVLLRARDRCLRDMSSMHGSYRKVSETRPAVQLIGKTLDKIHGSCCVWYLDKPVSNSGRLKKIIEQLAENHHWPWKIDIVVDPDKVLQQTDQIVVSADSVILDNCNRWLNLSSLVLEQTADTHWVIDMT